MECGNKGHLKFNILHVKEFKRREAQATLQCEECIARLAAINKKLQEKTLGGARAGKEDTTLATKSALCILKKHLKNGGQAVTWA